MKIPEVILYIPKKMPKAAGEYKRRVKVKPEHILSTLAEHPFCYLSLIYIDPVYGNRDEQIDTLTHEFAHFLQMKFGYNFWQKTEELQADLIGRTVSGIFKGFEQTYSLSIPKKKLKK